MNIAKKVLSRTLSLLESVPAFGTLKISSRNTSTSAGEPCRLLIITACAIGLLALITSTQPQAGIVYGNDAFRGYCRDTFTAQKGYNVTYVRTVSTIPITPSSTTFQFRREYEVTTINENDNYKQPCYEYTNWGISNNPSGPAQGTKTKLNRDGFLNLLKGKIQDGVRKKYPGKYNTPFIQNGTQGTVTGRRGSLLGFSLFENSPDYVIAETETDFSDADLVVIPFIIDSKGDEDWLEFAVNGTVFFRESLANLEVGEWYEADVPLSLLTEPENIWSYYLDSAGAANSSVFLPTSIAPVDIDVDPWSAANDIRPASNNLIAVAVKGSNVAAGDDRDFDATQIDPASLQLGVGEAANVATPWVADFDGDTLTDVAFGFRTQDTGIFCGDTEVTLFGETFSGDPFTGTDTISTTDCVDTGCHP